MKKSIISGVLALTVFLGVSQTIATPVAHAQNISIQQLIQLFISLGIIPADKVAMVEAAFGMANTTGTVVTVSPTTSPTITCNNLWWHDSSTLSCSQKQFCGSYMYQGLKTFTTQTSCDADLQAITVCPNIVTVAGKADITSYTNGACITTSTTAQ